MQAMLLCFLQITLSLFSQGVMQGLPYPLTILCYQGISFCLLAKQTQISVLSIWLLNQARKLNLDLLMFWGVCHCVFLSLRCSSLLTASFSLQVNLLSSPQPTNITTLPLLSTTVLLGAEVFFYWNLRLVQSV